MHINTRNTHILALPKYQYNGTYRWYKHPNLWAYGRVKHFGEQYLGLWVWAQSSAAWGGNARVGPTRLRVQG